MLETVKDKTDEASKTKDSANITNSTNLTAYVDDNSTSLARKKFEASYPDPILTKDQIKYWGFVIYLIGK
jgi:hypothetical protein